MQLVWDFNFYIGSSGGGEDDALQKMAQTVANSITNGGAGSGSENNSDTNDFQAAIARALKGISATNENLQVSIYFI